MLLLQAHAVCEYKLLTNRHAEMGRVPVPPFVGSRLGDPASPFIDHDGDLEIYGTGNEYLKYSSSETLTAAQSLILAAEPQVLKVHLAYPGGALINEGLIDETPWDLAVEQWPDENILYAGVMTPTADHVHAVFAEDNWNRRVFAFRMKNGIWMREPRPITYPETKSWIGHSYGHQFIKDENGQTWIFYERVMEEKESKPWITGLFARKMLTPFRSSKNEIKIFDPTNLPYAALNRQFGGKLVEGARPYRVSINGKNKFVILFSSGDFPTNNYGINMAFSDQLLGPYQPALNGDETDLKDFGKPLRNSGDFAWGPSRASLFYNSEGSAFILFHAVRARLWPDFDFEHWPDFGSMPVYRDYFIAPVDFEAGTENGVGIQMNFRCQP